MVAWPIHLWATHKARDRSRGQDEAVPRQPCHHLTNFRGARGPTGSRITASLVDNRNRGEVLRGGKAGEGRAEDE